MTDGQGRTVNFKNTIIIMTSNIGQRHIAAGLLGEGELTPERIDAVTARVLDDMRARVAPEFINRIDETVMFLPLTRDDIHAVTELQLKGLRRKLAARELNMEFTPAATDWLAAAGYSPEYGARPVKRVIDEYVVNALSMELLAGRIDKGQTIRVDATSDAIVFSNAAAN
jgi:ATP-dependent Clp protease ATP-binding subunit ClpB